MDSTTEQKQLFRQSRFTGIRVTDNGECAPALNF